MHRVLTVLSHIYKKFGKQGWVFLWIPLNPMSLTCGLTAAEATQGKEQGKELRSRAIQDHTELPTTQHR